MDPSDLPRSLSARRIGASKSRTSLNSSRADSPSGSPRSSAHFDRDIFDGIRPRPVVLGICAMDVKARSRAMREIMTRILQRGQIEVKVFGDKVILDEDVENWPRCDILISFFSAGFPLAKASEYVKLRKPVCVNDLPMQAILWDRRCVLAILDHLKVPTPKRLVVSRDGGPKVEPELARLVEKNLGITFGNLIPTPEVSMRADGDSIIVDGAEMEKPFVEKPVSGEDHNVYIYFKGGGGRRLFRKIGNQSSEMDPNLNDPRTDGSYIYEKFVDVDNSEDIKVYTLGPGYAHAETRKSPVVDGVVRRNTDGKEIRFVTHLTEPEKLWARKICEAFGQRVCGFDLLRCENGSKSMVIDVNGWSFVKGNVTYYDKASEILYEVCRRCGPSIDRPDSMSMPFPDLSPTWTLKANVTVFRHADRTPKQKLKFNFPVSESWTSPFIRLLNGEKEEILLREAAQLNMIASAIQEATTLGASGEDLAKLTLLNKTLENKINLPGTKAQLKPGFTKGKLPPGTHRKLEKLQLVFKWGGEFTHAARYQSRDLGENMKKDLSIMNKDVLSNVKIYTSSERRVVASAEIFAAALLDGVQPSHTPASATPIPGTPVRSSRSSEASGPFPPHQPIQLLIRKDLLDDSNAAKDLMDDVKKRLKILLRPGEPEKRPELAWRMKKEPVEVVKEVMELLSQCRDTMRRRFETMNVNQIQTRWCCQDEPWLFRERWDKLFEDFCDVKQAKFDPSKVSELYDTIKYCALHHRTFLFAIFDAGGEEPRKSRQLHELYGRAKALFDLVAPQEYGIEAWEKEEIGILTSLPLLRNVVGDLEEARNNELPLFTAYFTKESHIHTLVNLVLSSGLPITLPRISELDYLSHITFELYERNQGREKSDTEYSIKLSLSEGAHSSNVLDSALDARHSLNVRTRRGLTQHLDYSLVIDKLSKHFGRVTGDQCGGDATDTIVLPVPKRRAASPSEQSFRGIPTS